MTLARFKLKKTNLRKITFATFQERPCWNELALEIKESFGISQKHVDVVYIDDGRNAVHLDNQEALQRFYDHRPNSSEAIKFVVQDKTVPDDTVISDTWSHGSNRSKLSKRRDKFKLFCWIIDKSDNPFPVNIAQNDTVGDLKQSIKNQRELNHLASDSLTLFKLNELILVDPDHTLAERIHEQGDDLSIFATRLSSGKKLSDIFQPGPPEGYLHIIALCPAVAKRPGSPSIGSGNEKTRRIEAYVGEDQHSAKRQRTQSLSMEGCRSRNPDPSLPLYIPLQRPNILKRSSTLAENIGIYAQRLETVAAIYGKLCRYKYVQVRGTPASGKTTLANLLQHYIAKQEPDALVVLVPSWRTQDQLDQMGGWRKWLADRWNAEDGSVLIVDEAQTSFRDISFWTHIKGINENWRYRVITFSTYGSTGSEDSAPTNHSPYLNQVVGLHKIDHGDYMGAGLLLTEAEFNEFVKKRFIGHCFDEQFLLGIYELTGGHVGACEDVLDVIQTHDSYRGLKGTGGLYTPDILTENVEVAALFRALSGKSNFSRGLPKMEYLQLPAVAEILQEVLRCGKKSIVDPLPHSGEVIDPAFTTCIKNGWLYNQHSSPMCATRDYTFASPLHRRFVEWMFLGNPKRDQELKEENLTKFALAVIRKISPLNLVEQRQVGPSVQFVPEAPFQDEMYRACLSHTENCVVSFPEFGTKRGRIDFFIPSKKWGIELLGNGDRLSSHMQRFTEGEYGRWTRTGVMNDYIILDFRTNPPRANYREMNNLYYVVYQKDYKVVQVYNNKQELIDDFVPTYDVLC